MKEIRLDNIRFRYKTGSDIFSGFSLCLRQSENGGTVTAIMGASGTGKTTLMKMLLGLLQPESGTITISPVGSAMGYVPQDPVLFEQKSIGDNARYFQFAGPYRKKFNEALYNRLVRTLRLESIINEKKSVNELSGGQKQRLSLLRSLTISPDFLLLDEPCTGLDSEVKQAFLGQLREIAASLNLHILYVTHHKSEAELIADDIVYLVKSSDGSVKQAAMAPTDTFSRTPPVVEAVSVFKFPGYKLLPVSDLPPAPFRITGPGETRYTVLIEEHNLILGAEDAPFRFELASKNEVYSVIKHEPADLHWFVKTATVAAYQQGDSIPVDFAGLKTIYDSKGLLLK